MKRGTPNLSGLISAALLSALTLGVFMVLREYGPESALRKFHRAAVNGNTRELARAVTPGSYPENLLSLASMVHSYARQGAQYQLKNVDRKERRVVAEVAYILPTRQMEPHMFWVVDKRPEGWRVNVNATADVRRMIYGF